MRSSSGRKLEHNELPVDVVYQHLEDTFDEPWLFVIIASPAPLHLSHGAPYLKNNTPLLIEKPISDSLTSFDKWLPIYWPHRDRIMLGYNLRFLPSYLFLQEIIRAKKIGNISSVMVNVGQYLPLWRPGTDYRQYVSANKTLGGGVLLELSHELDYLLSLFGSFKKIFCCETRSGFLDLDVEDTIDAILINNDGIRVNVHMDFLQHEAHRSCKIVGELGTLNWDLLSNSVTLCSVSGEMKYLFSQKDYLRNEMYIEELKTFAQVVAGNKRPEVGLVQEKQFFH